MFSCMVYVGVEGWPIMLPLSLSIVFLQIAIVLTVHAEYFV